MYFSPLVKQELARIMPDEKFEQISELLAFVIMNGKINSFGGLLITLDNPAMIKVVYFLIKKAFHFEARIDIIRKNDKKKIYYVTINDIQKTKLILTQLGLGVNNRSNIIRENTVKEKEKVLINHFCEKPFLRGAFLAGGFLNDPERMYHLEIACPSKEVAQMINNILHRSTFSSKISFWQKKWTVYLKKSEQIFAFLRFIGVQRALLNLQDIIARKDILNTVNRLVNCETANLNKTISSAYRQLLYIDLILKKIDLDNLPPNIKEVVKARSEHPYVSIRELAEIIGGGITKSGVSHRLKKMERMAGYYLTSNEIY